MYTKKKRNKTIPRLAFAFIGLLFVGLALTPFARRGFANLGMYASRGAATVRAMAIGSVQSEKVTDLSRKVSILKKENKELSRKVEFREYLLQENNKLKTLLGQDENEVEDLLLARVVLRPPFSNFDTFVLDIGGGAVEKGDTVFADLATEVGSISRIEETDDGRRAYLELYSTAGVRTPLVIRETGELVVAEGIGGGQLVVNVSKTFEVKEGYTLMRPGITSHVVAKIEDVEESTGAFTKARARIPVSLSTHSWVLIETDEE